VRNGTGHDTPPAKHDRMKHIILALICSYPPIFYATIPPNKNASKELKRKNKSLNDSCDTYNNS